MREHGLVGLQNPIGIQRMAGFKPFQNVKSKLSNGFKVKPVLKR